jgi:hypothetical protein
MTPAQGKLAAIRAYCGGLLTLEQCGRLFSKHPDWRHA